MQVEKSNIIARLQQDIFRLQGFKSGPQQQKVKLGLPLLEQSFPSSRFPIGAIHEFLTGDTSTAATSSAFIVGIISRLMQFGGASIWISAARTIFPPALAQFGIEPDKVIFIDLKNNRDVLWAMEEALKCSGLAAVVGELRDIDFTASRRFQLAVEQSNVTGFILHQRPQNIKITASVSRWKIQSLPSGVHDDLPGVGFPRWKVDLLKIRNGKPGSWQIEWQAGSFKHIDIDQAEIHEDERKVG